MIKMTNVEAYNAIGEILEDMPQSEKVTALLAWLDNRIEVTEKSLAKGKARRDAKKAAAGPDELETVVYSLLTKEPQSINDIAKQIDGQVNAPMLSSRLNNLIKAGKATREKVSFPKTETEPAHSYMTYRKA